MNNKWIHRIAAFIALGACLVFLIMCIIMMVQEPISGLFFTPFIFVSGIMGAHYLGKGFNFSFTKGRKSKTDSRSVSAHPSLISTKTNTVICPKCGKVCNNNDLHCSNCGTALYKECPKCHKHNSINSIYCSSCGEKL